MNLIYLLLKTSLQVDFEQSVEGVCKKKEKKMTSFYLTRPLIAKYT